MAVVVTGSAGFLGQRPRHRAGRRAAPGGRRSTGGPSVRRARTARPPGPHRRPARPRRAASTPPWTPPRPSSTWPAARACATTRPTSSAAATATTCWPPPACSPPSRRTCRWSSPRPPRSTAAHRRAALPRGRPARAARRLRPQQGGGRGSCAGPPCGAGGRVTIARPFTVVGEGQRPDMALSRAGSRPPAPAGRCRVYGSPGRTRDFTDVRDVARALVDPRASRGAHRAWSTSAPAAAHTLAEAVAAVAAALGAGPRTVVRPAAAVEVGDTLGRHRSGCARSSGSCRAPTWRRSLVARPGCCLAGRRQHWRAGRMTGGADGGRCRRRRGCAVAVGRRVRRDRRPRDVRRPGRRRRAAVPADGAVAVGGPHPRHLRRDRRASGGGASRRRPAGADRACSTAAGRSARTTRCCRCCSRCPWGSAAGSAPSWRSRVLAAGAVAALTRVDRGSPVRRPAAGSPAPAPPWPRHRPARGLRPAGLPGTARCRARSCSRSPRRPDALGRRGLVTRRHSPSRRAAVAVGQVRPGRARSSRWSCWSGWPGPAARRATSHSPAVLAAAGVLYLGLHRLWWGGWTVYASGDHFTSTGELSVVGVRPRLRRPVAAPGRPPGRPRLRPRRVAAGLAARRRRLRRAGPPPPAGRPPRCCCPLAAGWAVATWAALTMHGFWWPGRQVVVVLPLAAGGDAVVACTPWPARWPARRPPSSARPAGRDLRPARRRLGRPDHLGDRVRAG